MICGILYININFPQIYIQMNISLIQFCFLVQSEKKLWERRSLEGNFSIATPFQLH